MLKKAEKIMTVRNCSVHFSSISNLSHLYLNSSIIVFIYLFVHRNNDDDYK